METNVVWLGALGAALMLSCGTRDTDPRLPRAPRDGAMEREAEGARSQGPEHRFCGYIHAYEGSVPVNLGVDAFAAHAADFDAIHPKWWRVQAAAEIVNHPFHDPAPFPGFHDARVLDNTSHRGRRTQLVPMVQATSPHDRAVVHALIHDPALRKGHVRALVNLAVVNRYDGLDLDYEHLSSEVPAGQSLDAERAAFTALAQELAAALHSAGKTLSFAVPALTSARSSVYDYDALSTAADQLHVMAYDFHYSSGEHVGPTAPLGWVRDAIDYIGTIDGGRRANRFILGLPNYGILGAPGGETRDCEPLSRCLDLLDGSGSYATTTDELTSCPDRGEEVIECGRSPNATLANGDRMFFEDLASLEEKVEAAAEGGMGGIGYWSMGGEPEEPAGRSFFTMVRGHFPRR
jgi:spore germination protein YaaH